MDQPEKMQSSPDPTEMGRADLEARVVDQARLLEEQGGAVGSESGSGCERTNG